MSEETFPGEDQFLSMFRQMGATMQEQLQARYEYRQCLWDEVNDAAREGWEVHPSGPWPVMMVFTDPETQKDMTRNAPGFLMFRKRSVADDAAEMIRQGFPEEFAKGIADGSIPVVEFPNELPDPPAADAGQEDTAPAETASE